MTRVAAALAGAFAAVVCALAIAGEPVEVPLWMGEAPDELPGIGEEYVRMSPALERKQVEVTVSTRMITNVTRPAMMVYRPPKERESGTAMLVFPGGGYWNLYWELEGEEVAKWLNEQGITAFVVKYRVPRRPGEPKADPAMRPLQDAQRAMSLVRTKAKSWGVDPGRIGVIGFSAGGHLAISTATRFPKRAYAPADEFDGVSCRPDFAIGVYSGYLKAVDKDAISSHLSIPEDTPPVFLVHGHEDIISDPEHSLFMYLALKRAGVSTELHIYASTTHDFGVRRTDRPYSMWTDTCTRWLKDQELHRPRE